jgi:hypothetical protein
MEEIVAAVGDRLDSDNNSVIGDGSFNELILDDSKNHKPLNRASQV